MKNQFMLDPNIIYLNHGSFGACAKPIYENLMKWQRELEQEPVKFLENTIFNALAKSRASLANYINCHADDLVYFPNPTTAINAVARSLVLKSDDEVLSTNHIYGALDKSWKYICEEKNAKFIKANIPLPINSKEKFMECFLRHVTKKTKAIFLDHITSATAIKFPVEEIINFTKENGILSIIDGAHVPGHIPLNINKLDPDIYTGACHKWMCAPKGVSFLYVKRKLQENIHPLIISWGWKSENPGKSKFLDWHEWQGTRDMSAFLTIPTAINFLKKYNWPKLGLECQNKVIELRNQFVTNFDINPICPDEWLGQMASIPLPINDENKFKEQLLTKYHIQVPVFKWEGISFLRYSIQVYNSDNDLDKLLNSVKKLLN